MFTKMFGPPPLANDYSYADRTTTTIMPRASRVKAETIYSRPLSLRDVMHILELHYAWWERRMRDNGKEDARRMRDNEKEDARKRGGGADKRWGALWRYSTVLVYSISSKRLSLLFTWTWCIIQPRTCITHVPVQLRNPQSPLLFWWLRVCSLLGCLYS